MEASTSSTTAVAVRPVLFTREEELALVGFLAGYSGLPRDAYALDLRQYVAWCNERDITMFGARRADIGSRHRGSVSERGTRARSRRGERPCGGRSWSCWWRGGREGPSGEAHRRRAFRDSTEAAAARWAKD
jgi:hypothetical protein